MREWWRGLARQCAEQGTCMFRAANRRPKRELCRLDPWASAVKAENDRRSYIFRSIAGSLAGLRTCLERHLTRFFFMRSGPLASSPILHNLASGTRRPPNLALTPPRSDWQILRKLVSECVPPNAGTVVMELGEGYI